MKFLSLFFVLLSFSALAGDRVGNGGDIVYCEGSQDTFFILEEYEEGAFAKVGAGKMDYTAKVKLLINKVRPSFPVRAAYYDTLFQHFQKTVVFLNAYLPDIKDEGTSIELPNGCDIAQAAYFKLNSKNEPVYHIQKKIWNLLSHDQKAVLVFHELIYTEAVGLGHLDSSNIRKANRIVYGQEVYNPFIFEARLIGPLQKMEATVSKLSNAYSEFVAIYLLKQDLSRFYSDRALLPQLLILKRRFNSSQQVSALIEDHLRRMGHF